MLRLLVVCALLSTINALPVEDGHLVAAIDGNEVQKREVRSLTDGLGWHLDRIDQRERKLDGKYCPIGQGNKFTCLDSIHKLMCY